MLVFLAVEGAVGGVSRNPSITSKEELYSVSEIEISNVPPSSKGKEKSLSRIIKKLLSSKEISFKLDISEKIAESGWTFKKILGF